MMLNNRCWSFGKSVFISMPNHLIPAVDLEGKPTTSPPQVRVLEVNDLITNLNQ